MKVLAPGILALAASLSISVAATVKRPVTLPSKSCCDDCTVARYVPAGVPVVAPTMVHGAAILEASVLLGTLGLVLAGRRRRRPPSSSPQPTNDPVRPAKI